MKFKLHPETQLHLMKFLSSSWQPGILIWTIATYFLATACGPLYSSSSSTTDSSTGYWSGTLTGSEGVNSVSENLSGTLSEDASGNLSGTFSASDGSSASVTGVVSGSTVSNLNVQVSSVITTSSGSASCQGYLGGTGQFNGSALGASLSGTVNCGSSNMTLNLSASSS